MAFLLQPICSYESQNRALMTIVMNILSLAQNLLKRPETTFYLYLSDMHNISKAKRSVRSAPRAPPYATLHLHFISSLTPQAHFVASKQDRYRRLRLLRDGGAVFRREVEDYKQPKLPTLNRRHVLRGERIRCKACKSQ